MEYLNRYSLGAKNDEKTCTFDDIVIYADLAPKCICFFDKRVQIIFKNLKKSTCKKIRLYTRS